MLSEILLLDKSDTYKDSSPEDPVFYSNRENTPSIAIVFHRMGGDESRFLFVLRYWFVSGFEQMCILCTTVLEVFVISDIISVISFVWHNFCKCGMLFSDCIQKKGGIIQCTML